MKAFLTLILTSFLFSYSFCQSTDTNSFIKRLPIVSTVNIDDDVFTKVEIQSMFPGGNEAWKSYLKKNLNRDVPNNNYASRGIYTVVIRFIVKRDGTIEKPVPETVLGYGMESEAIRVIMSGPKWIPGSQNGEIVNSYHRQDVTFRVK